MDAPPPDGTLHYDRTLTEWLQHLDQIQKTTKAFPWYRKHVEALHDYFYKQQYIRRCVEKCAFRMIRRLIDRRPLDLCDLYTTLPIPTRSLVTVYDMQHRKKYAFHTHTATKLIELSLQYSSCGIAKPSAPKNPYTNVPWSFGQLMSMVQQISLHLLRNHTFPPADLQRLRRANYSILTLYTQNKRFMDIRAAEHFFQQKDEPWRDVIYEEIVHDLHDDMFLVPNMTKVIMKRELPESILYEWDAVVLASFLETNLHIYTETFKTSQDIHTAVLRVHTRTIEYRRSLRKSQRTNLQTPAVRNDIVLLPPVVRMTRGSLDDIIHAVQNLSAAFDEAREEPPQIPPTMVHMEFVVESEYTNSVRDLIQSTLEDSKQDE